MITFNLKKQWFDKIKSGEKTHEYREVKPYWDSRLKFVIDLLEEEKRGEYIRDGRDPFFYCQFRCGYPDVWSLDKIIWADIKNIRIVNGKTTDLAIDKPVYDIEFEVIK